MKKFIIALILLLVTSIPTLCFAERTITLPYSQTNFASPTDDDLIWGQGGGSTTSFTSTGCWSGSCVIATPPTDCEQGGSFGLGAFTLSESVPQLNLRFLMKIGSTYYSTASSCAGEGLGNKLVDTLQVGEAGRSIAGLLTDSHVPPTTSPYPFGLCTSGPSGTDYNCDNGGGGIDPCYYWYPSGRHTTTGCGYDRLHFGKDIATDYDNQWVSVELEYVRNGYNKIYVYTLDGTLAGLYVTNDALSNDINWQYVRHIGGYSNQDHPDADANTYIMFDEIAMSTSYIGPPAGFTDGDTTAPTILSVSSNKANGSYKAGEVIDIDVTFSEAVTSTGNVTVTLETGDTDRTCTFTVTNATTGTCNYTVQAGDTSADLQATISGTIADQASNAMSNYTPTTNLAANKALVIDTTVPTVDAFTVPATSATRLVTSSTFTCTGATAYLMNESAETPSVSDAAWTASAPTSYTFSSDGNKTLYAYCKDLAGNISEGVSDTVTVTTSAISKAPFVIQ